MRPLLYGRRSGPERMTEIIEKLSEMAEEVAAQSGVEIVDLRVSGRNVAVFIDGPGGVSVGQCAEFSREMAVLIDVEGILGSSYNLEVSSPGAERPLKKPGDYNRFCGRRVKVRTKEARQGRRVFIGRIDGTDEGFVKITGEDAGTFSIPFESIEKANLQREL